LPSWLRKPEFRLGLFVSISPVNYSRDLSEQDGGPRMARLTGNNLKRLRNFRQKASR